MNSPTPFASLPEMDAAPDSERAPSSTAVPGKRSGRMRVAAPPVIDPSVLVDAARRHLETEASIIAIHRRQGALTPAPVEARHAALLAGIAFASAGEPRERSMAAWRLASLRLREHFEWQERTQGCVMPGYADLTVLAAAHLAEAAGPVLEVLSRAPLAERRGQPERHHYFARLVAGGLAPPKVSATPSERADLARHPDLLALADMVEAARADVAPEALASSVETWLRIAWVRADRRHMGTASYPGPIALLPCLLLSRAPTTPDISPHLARYVDERVVAWGRSASGR